MSSEPLWTRREVAAAPEQAITSVHHFLQKCRAWGTEREIPKLLARLSEQPTPGDAAKLHQWTSWVAFLDHAAAELEEGKLDPWFLEQAVRASEP